MSFKQVLRVLSPTSRYMKCQIAYLDVAGLPPRSGGVARALGPVMFCGYQTKYQAQQQQRFLLILIYSSRYVQLQSG